jgi:hypothetical protein
MNLREAIENQKNIIQSLKAEMNDGNPFQSRADLDMIDQQIEDHTDLLHRMQDEELSTEGNN